MNLRCDGHPQCEHGEDEDLDDCYKTYLRNKVVLHYATFRCRSYTYPIMEMFVTACDGVVECLDEADESFCRHDFSILFFVYTFLGVFFLFLGLNVIHMYYYKYWSHQGQLPHNEVESDTFEEMLEKYEAHHYALDRNPAASIGKEINNRNYVPMKHYHFIHFISAFFFKFE